MDYSYQQNKYEIDKTLGIKVGVTGDRLILMTSQSPEDVQAMGIREYNKQC